MSLFGMGIEIDFKDNASAGLKGLSQTFDETNRNAEDMVNNIDAQMSALNQSALGASSMLYAGEKLVGMGSGILGTFKGWSDQIVQTGADFENTRITLEALYKSKDVAEEKLKWALDFGAKTPFDIADTKKVMVSMKAVGVEVDQMITSTSGKTQELLAYIGDLGALRPDVGIRNMSRAIVNALGGNTRSLRAMLDIDVDKVLGRKFGKGGAETVAQDIADLVDKIGAEGLMFKLFGTWNQMISEIGDQFARIKLYISDAGAFDSMKNVLQSIFDTVRLLSDEDLTKMGESISDIVETLVKPVQWLVDQGIKAFHWLVNLVKEHPNVVKFVAVLVALTGVALILVGGLLIFNAILALIPITLKLVVLNMRKFAIVMGLSKYANIGAIKLFGLMALKMMLVIGALYLLHKAWKTDFAGIRTFTMKLKDAVTNAFRIMRMDIKTFSFEVDRLASKDDPFSKFTIGVMKVTTFLKALFDVFGDNTMSKDTWLLAEKLGLLPLIETILDAKAQWEAMFKGIKTGAESALESIKGMASWLWDKLVAVGDLLDGLGFSGVKDSLKGVNDEAGKVDFTSYEKLGEVIGKIGVYLLVFKIASKFKFIGSAILGVSKNFSKFALMAGKFLIANPIVLVIALIIGAVILLYNKVEWFRNGVNKFLKFVNECWDATVVRIVNAINKVKEFFGIKEETLTLKVKTEFDLPTKGEIGYLSGLTNVVAGARIQNPRDIPIKGSRPVPVQASTGGYTLGEGLVNLHPNELIVNSNLTRMLGSFLEKDSQNTNKPQIAKKELVNNFTNETSKLITEKSSNTVIHQDYSITIERDAVSVTLESGNEQDATKLFNELWKKIERKQEVEKARKYKSIPV